jgi:hypothetical protein
MLVIPTYPLILKYRRHDTESHYFLHVGRCYDQCILLLPGAAGSNRALHSQEPLFAVRYSPLFPQEVALGA